MTAVKIIPSSILAQAIADPGFLARFWSKILRCPHGEACHECCWRWQAGTSQGYGTIGYTIRPHVSIPLAAHRVSWLLFHRTLPENLYVLHDCPSGDNPACVNPQHLWLGTNADNIRDAIQKGRLKPPTYRGGSKTPPRHKGEELPWAKLTEENVKDIRYLAACGMPKALLARIYDIRRRHIKRCINGETWKHVS